MTPVTAGWTGLALTWTAVAGAALLFLPLARRRRPGLEYEARHRVGRGQYSYGADPVVRYRQSLPSTPATAWPEPVCPRVHEVVDLIGAT